MTHRQSQTTHNTITLHHFTKILHFLANFLSNSQSSLASVVPRWKDGQASILVRCGHGCDQWGWKHMEHVKWKTWLNWVNQRQLCGSHFGQAVDVWISRSVSCFAQADRLWYHENHMMHRIPHTTDSPAQNSQKCWRNPYKSYQIHSNPNSCDRFPGPLPWSQFPPGQAGSGRDFWQGLEAIKFWHHTHVSPKAEGFRDFWVHWKMHWNSWNMIKRSINSDVTCGIVQLAFGRGGAVPPGHACHDQKIHHTGPQGFAVCPLSVWHASVWNWEVAHVGL